MANSVQILDKVVRDMTMRGYTAARVGTTATVTKTGGDVLVVSYVNAMIQSPMGGIDDTTSPFLGIGIANPGQLLLKGAAGENTLAAIMNTVEAVVLLAELAGYANSIVIQAGDTTAQLAYIAGHETLLGMGA